MKKRILLLALTSMLTLSPFIQSKAYADSPSWMSGVLTGEQRDDLSKNPDEYGAYGNCTYENTILAGNNSPTSLCVFHATSFRYTITSSGQLYVQMANDEKMYPVTNIGFASNMYVLPSPNTNDFIFNSTISKNLPSRLTFSSAYAGSYTPDDNLMKSLSKDELGDEHATSSRSVSLNGEWELLNIQNIGLVRIHLTDFTATRLTSYENLNKFSAISDDGRYVAITSFNGSSPLIYDLNQCGQSATSVQSSWVGSTPSSPCASRDLSGVIYTTVGGGFTVSAKPEFNDNGWQLTMFASNGAYNSSGITLSAANYVAPANNTDSDGDGLSDQIESLSYNKRQAVFCGITCTYPDPSKKDLYVEIDWMKEPGGLGRSFKPTTSQLELINTTFAAHGIQFHADTGQFGGGNVLPDYISNLRFTKDTNGEDFYDYKNGSSSIPANFNSLRSHIWHYMISGYEWNDGNPNTNIDVDSSGVSYFSDDDTFISTGLITDNPGNGFTYSTIDNAIAGTMLHELGHNLCLTNKITALRSECYSQYIDSSNVGTYYSVMNYSYQMSDVLDYSDNSSPNIHDDWSAIALGFRDFTSDNWSENAGSAGYISGVNRAQAEQLKKERRIFSKVDHSKRSLKRQAFDKAHNL